MFKPKLEQQDIEAMVGVNDSDEPSVANLSNSLSSLASMARRTTNSTTDSSGIADISRRIVSNPDYNPPLSGKSSFASNSDELTRKDSSSSSSLESLSNTSSAGVQSSLSYNLFSSQTRSTPSSSSTKPISTDQTTRLSGSTNRSSSKVDIAPPLPPGPKPTSKSQPSSVTSKLSARGITLYQCIADNESELSFNVNEIVTQIRPSREPGWIMGTINGKTGLIPENYIAFTGGV